MQQLGRKLSSTAHPPTRDIGALGGLKGAAHVQTGPQRVGMADDNPFRRPVPAGVFPQGSAAAGCSPSGAVLPVRCPVAGAVQTSRPSALCGGVTASPSDQDAGER